VQKQHGGALLIEKSGCRYALGGGMAHKINVTRC
jgi:Fe2+ transport system protein FeoA